MKKVIISHIILLCSVFVNGQVKLRSVYRAELVRPDSNTVVFNFQAAKENNQLFFYFINASEKIKVGPINVVNDSVNFSMPVFESSFKTKLEKDGSFHGIWTKGTEGEYQYWLFYAHPDQRYRFISNLGTATQNITGRWDVTFTKNDTIRRKSVAEFEQRGDHLTGTFLNTTGDYRYLDGIVTGDSMKLSTFDGAHAYTFYAAISNNGNSLNGVFYAGLKGKETWTAVRNENINKPEQNAPTRLKEGESKLNFTFNDLDGKPVSINDDRFKNKVVIIQIMGSWCPNCMDETKFLSDYYNRKRDPGVEIIALAYEYTTNLERSKKSLEKFQKLFNVQYPTLITGVSSVDDEKTEKTLPQLTPIKSFPTTIFLDKKGNVRKIEGVFYGPGTGEHFEEYKKEFYDTIDKLLKEN